MRIESVLAHAFGPLVEESLTLAPGMTVIHGPNEAGKSSWHAALYAGLCGAARGRGRGRREDQEFRTRHRPWSGGPWQVGMLATLEDGRRVELQHDLDGRVDCRAVDAMLGRDLSHEIISDGAPDGARWLGLDRRAFLAVACVRQADLLGVLERPDHLKDYLQRAADSLPQDTSVAAAIDRIEQYRRDHVGRDVAHAVKPLRRAVERLEQAKEELSARQETQARYLSLLDMVAGQEGSAQAAQRRLALFRAKRAGTVAQEAERRLVRARHLTALHADGPPSSLAADDALAHTVATALHDWEARPAEPALGGESAAELEVQLSALPSAPVGDTDPHPVVIEAAQAFALVNHTLEYQLTRQPARGVRPPTGGATPAQLRQLAGVLAAAAPTVDPALRDRCRRAKERASSHGGHNQGPVRLALTLAALLAVLGLAVALLHMPAVSLGLVVAAGMIGIWAAREGGGAARKGEQDELREAELALHKAQVPVEVHQRRRDEAQQQLRLLGLAPVGEELERLAAACEQAEQQQRDLMGWTDTWMALLADQKAAERRLADALQVRGVAVAGSATAAHADYLAACAQRRTVAADATRRTDLQRRLADRQETEAAAADVTLRRKRAEAHLRRAALAAGAPDADLDTLAADLRAWQRRRHDELATTDDGRRSWAELLALLDGSSLDDLEANARQLAETAEGLAADLDQQALATFVLEPDCAAQEQRLAAAAQLTQASLERAKGQLAERRRLLRSVPEAEEALAAAQAEYDRVRTLDGTLELTRDFLMKAQDSVHQSVAPILAGAVRRRLPAVTAHRYTDVRVDPESLDVQVLAPDGRWRQAALLSHGTAEQVYLLLRVALAQYLTKPGEVCPLILDDVTVHCDADRKRAVLETLHAVSRERQVILFSQEDAVLAWANDVLEEPSDRIVCLAPTTGTGHVTAG